VNQSAVTTLGDLIERFDHVSMAVGDIEAAIGMAEAMGGSHFDGGLSPNGDFRWEQFSLPGQGTLELISSVDKTDTVHFINRFIAERGEGLHHLTFKVTDIDASVALAREAGFVVVGQDSSDPDWKEAFIHPKSSHGVLIQLAEFPDSH
jgi:methylmalonyl-CoA epimerase